MNNCILPSLAKCKRGPSYNSEYPAALRSAQIASFGRNFGYSRNVRRKNNFIRILEE